MNQPADGDWITFRELIEPLQRRWRLVATWCLSAATIAAAAALVIPRPFEAAAVLATVGGANPLSSLGPLAGAAAAFGGVALGKGDLNPTPDLISALLVSRKVLSTVGSGRLEDGRLLIEALKGEPVARSEVAREMRRFIRTSISPQTGLVTVTARHRDSGLARRVAASAIEETTRSFVDASRSQARGLRLAQEERLDSARRQVTRAEKALIGFLSVNRVVGDFSLKSVERDRLARDVDVARQVYLQATGDRESAVARELQQTPAIVILDPAPEDLPKRPRRALITALLAGLAGLLLGVLVVYLTGHGAQRGLGSA
ncbi:MAG: GNVR domain-containing protein [Gemmatimonadales bacterium]